MGRSLPKFLVALAMLAGLGGCDKCGDWQQLQFPQPPKSCADHGAR
jgi:hypothetical protein